MKREIKFRAWDNKRMVYLSDLSIGLKKGTKKICPYAYFTTDTFGDLDVFVIWMNLRDLKLSATFIKIQN